MDAQLHAQLDEVIEALRDELHQQAEYWSTIRTPSELFDFEQGLQAVLNNLQAGIVGTVLDAIHRDRDFVTDCRRQARRQRGVQSLGWHQVWVRTLGGKRVQLKTPYARVPTHGNQEGRSEKRFQHGTGIYPVLRRLGIVREATPRLLAEVNRQAADGPSVDEVSERFTSREIPLTRKPIWLQVRDLTSIALWQRQMALTHLDHLTSSGPTPLTGKRVVVGLDGGRLHLRLKKHGQSPAKTKGSTIDTCEPKLFVIYTIDHKGNKERKGQVTYDGTLQSAEYLFALLKLRLKQLGIAQAAMLVIIGDGASWIWKRVPELKTALKLEAMRVVEIVDWAHAAGKLMPPARVGIQESQQQQRWFKRMRNLLKQGDVSKIINNPPKG
jgi:hypothetical protein